VVAPFEFRSLAGAEVEALWTGNERRAEAGDAAPGGWHEAHPTLLEAASAARQEGYQQGEQEGRRAARVELEAEMRAAAARERERLVDAMKQFSGAREQYFADVEQAVVKLALAIAARVLHREAAIDPLLLSGVVRVALEKMADRSGVVLRVAATDVANWERRVEAMEPPDRPRVVEGAGLERGECVLETKMGTVELGVAVQLEEIEKGFFDLLNHRPVE
jgi:flagellar assembly protein FliH